ncbi:aspartyl-phosphate phosphatase Spo0E family protein [Paenibacillus sp. MAH-36]|uniref:Aspartyl-phosphate phosphatase Spo0E family protein n=1 Tax=Paenibacillus violae TaxID=3077234 RepID=A0ABU3RR03_9BACL|nr:aspartyl-phosphate phosphatase Spo0E family protein [Paenibacillus sp. PFR10]MDU0206409.1 aspartyl-phosphate phosphatase Spo0E family protein [Paenibacillus sp. PFR10]
MKEVTGLSKGEIERLAQEIERDRALLLRIGNSFQLIHSDLVRLSQVLDEKIVEYMKLKQHLRLANQQGDANNQKSCSND